MKIAKALVPLVFAAPLAGCASGFGPGPIHSERPDYNWQILRSAEAQIPIGS